MLPELHAYPRCDHSACSEWSGAACHLVVMGLNEQERVRGITIQPCVQVTE